MSEAIVNMKKGAKEKTVTGIIKAFGNLGNLKARQQVDNVLTLAVEGDASYRAVVTAYKHDGFAAAISTGANLLPPFATYTIPAVISGAILGGTGYAIYKGLDQVGAINYMAKLGNKIGKQIGKSKSGKWVTIKGRRIFIGKGEKLKLNFGKK